MTYSDDDLIAFEESGPPPLPDSGMQFTLEREGARIWYAAHGEGAPVILLHGGLGNSRNWGFQVPALTQTGYRVIVIDSRGHGRSTWDGRAFSYTFMALDALSVMDALSIAIAPVVGWSDGACAGLAMAKMTPVRVAGLFFFACNVDSSGVKPFVITPIIERCLARHIKDYQALSATPDQFKEFSDAVGEMQSTQPNYGPEDLASIQVPVTVAQSERDEFITAEHAAYIARSIPNANLVKLAGVSHFAPVQRPDQFNRAILDFLRNLA